MFSIVLLNVLLCHHLFIFFFFKQKTAYEMRISDWSSDVCSSDLLRLGGFAERVVGLHHLVELEAVCHEFLGREPSLRDELQEHRRRRGADEIGRASCRERVCQYV